MDDSIGQHGDSSSGVGDVAVSVNNDCLPCVGMEFPTDEDAYHYYNAYALRTGFGIRKTSSMYSRKSKPDEKRLIARTFVCDKEGKKQCQKDGGTCRRESRVGCGARMRITYTASNIWKVSRFVEEHTGHELTSPNKSIKHRSHMIAHKSQSVTSLIDRLRGEGLTPSTICKVLNVASGIEENTVTQQQCQDHIRKSRNNNIGNECTAIIAKFADKKASDPDFYFAWEVDENRTMRSVFWADGRSRSSYLHFGDVVVFDVTYKTNKLCLPFAPFTGVNHHRQSVLFGCALLADEEEETFVWLFTEWLKCMHGQPPISIITDQDIAMGNAIKRVFPNTRHRYCSWHIGKHVVEHLPKLQVQVGEGIVTYFNKWRYSANIEEAETNWRELQRRFEIDENANTWLPAMYRKRQHWIEAYLKDIFWAGMKSTQRSESINAFFDCYVNSQTRLHEFVSCYDKALRHRREAELHEDFRTLSTKPPMDSCHEIEVQAGKLYTANIFRLFQEEMRGICKLIRKEECRNGPSTVYSIGSVSDGTNGRHQVVYEESETVRVKCSCALFETSGILCRHILNVMCNLHQLQAIPEQYVLNRWRIDARYQSNKGLMQIRNVDSTEANVREAMAIRLKFNEILSMIMESTDLKARLQTLLDDFVVQNGLNRIQQNVSQVESNTTLNDISAQVTIRDPSGPAVTKGRPKGATRFRSSLEEQIQKQKKKQRTCQNCFQKGHYRTSCKNPSRLLDHTQALQDDLSDDNNLE